MEAANQILETLIRTRNHNKSASVSSGLSGRTLRPGGPPGHQDNAALAYPQKPTDPYGPPRQASTDAVSAATNSYMIPQSPTAARQQIPPRPPTSSSPAAAAAAAATGLRTPQQPVPGESNCAICLQPLGTHTDSQTWDAQCNPSHLPMPIMTQLRMQLISKAFHLKQCRKWLRLTECILRPSICRLCSSQ